MDTTLSDLRFGRFQLNANRRELSADGAAVKLGARTFDVLLALVERRDRIVSKDELLKLVWPNLIVEENNLQVHVSSLRKLLGPQAIATVPGRGYRFTVSVEGVAQVSVAPAATPAAEATERPSVTNLPDALPPLYGRDAEVAEVVQLLVQHRLVSIVGAGGIGKTRLGLAVAHLMRDRFADGVWLVELAALSDPARVASKVAQTLNMLVNDASNALEAATDAVRGKSLMLVLDNCEHVLEAVTALVIAIRRAAPGATLLTTTQEPLKIGDEHRYRLAPLAVPPPDADLCADAASGFGAITLFVARAQAADSHFALDAGNAGTVLDICRRLDGIALALELAAARVPLLGVEGVRARLDERFNVLTGGARTALPRHQTLRAAFDWSHGLLSEAERTVFRRLAVFVGSFSLEAAQQIARDATMDVWEVLDHLAALVDKSLVAVERSDPPRYRLLETGRAYALEQLAHGGETNALARRHAQTYAALFESSYAKRWQARPAEHLACYRPELDNLRAALDWASRNDPDLEIGLVGAAAWLWRGCGLNAEGIAACELAVAHVQPATPAALEARLLSELAQTGRLRLSVEPTLRTLERAIALFQRLDDRVGLYLAAARSVPFLALAGDTDQTRRALANVQALEDPSWPPLLRIQRLQALETVLGFTGPAEELRAAAEQRRRLAYLAESTFDELSACAALVYADTMLGRFDEATRGGRELVAQFRRSGFAVHLGYPLADLALALSLKGELDEAVSLMREAVPLLKQQADLLFVLDRFALIAFLRGHTDSAARLFGASKALFEKLGHKRFFDEQHVHDDVLERLDQAFAPDELARLMREGESMSENEAIALVLRELE